MARGIQFKPLMSNGFGDPSSPNDADRLKVPIPRLLREEPYRDQDDRYC